MTKLWIWQESAYSHHIYGVCEEILKIHHSGVSLEQISFRGSICTVFLVQNWWKCGINEIGILTPSNYEKPDDLYSIVSNLISSARLLMKVPAQLDILVGFGGW